MIPSSDSMNTMVEQLQMISDLSCEQNMAQRDSVLASIRCKTEKMQLFPQSAESMDDWRQVNFRFRSYEVLILVRKYIEVKYHLCIWQDELRFCGTDEDRPSIFHKLHILQIFLAFFFAVEAHVGLAYLSKLSRM